MKQKEAVEELKRILGIPTIREFDECTGNAKTCPIEECMLCGVRDCPSGEPLHYHHDGCPACSEESA